jgi:hypothetical protein
MPAFRPLFLIGLLAAGIQTPCGAPPTPPSPAGSDALDQKGVHASYNDGDFEKVVSALEQFMAGHHAYAFEDSVFIAKHLAVVYSANPDTREKGKHYMYRLLGLLPSAKLVDMFVSDEIDRIFEKVREEFMVRQRGFGVDTARVSVPSRRPREADRDTVRGSRPPSDGPSGRAAAQNAGSRSGSNRTLYLAAGGAVVLGAGIAAYFVMANLRDEEKIYEVP